METAVLIFLIVSITCSTIIILVAIVGAGRGRNLARYNIEREIEDCPELERAEISTPLVPDAKPEKKLPASSSSTQKS